MLLELAIVQHVQTKSVLTCQPTKILVSTTVKSSTPAPTCSIFHLRIENWHLVFLVEIVHIIMQERRVVFGKKKNPLHFCRNLSANHNHAHPNLHHSGKNSFHLWHNPVDSALVDTVNQKFICILILYTCSPRWSNVILSVSKDGFDWSLNYVTLTAKDLIQQKAIRFHGNILAALFFLLSQRQDFLNNHLMWVPSTPNQERTMGWETKCSQV